MTAPLTPERLAEIRAGLEASTPGPWYNEPDTGAGRVWVQMGTCGRPAGDIEPVFSVRSKGPDRDRQFAQRAADAAFIAAAPTTVKQLLAEVERLTALIPNQDTPSTGEVDITTVGDRERVFLDARYHLSLRKPHERRYDLSHPTSAALGEDA